MTRLRSRLLELSPLEACLLALVTIAIVGVGWDIAVGSFVGHLRDQPPHQVAAISFQGTDWEELTLYRTGIVPTQAAPMVGGPCVFVDRPEINFFSLATPMRTSTGVSRIDTVKLALCAMTYTRGAYPMFFPYPWYGLLPAAVTVLLLALGAGLWLRRLGLYLLGTEATLAVAFALLWWLLGSLNSLSLP